ncbi:3' terminal RNA ribose 2'-O-methyltransferase Hen1 (plasmid) [Deinococcus sp. D7000]|nr:3' terminal RNA ribose 2'-O-methyltransferase Hen1 [Deinococcus sp. D7000]
MLLTLTTTHQPATDLGYLLHKHPDRTFTFELPVGQAQVFYPEVSEKRCTVAVLVEVDPVLISRGRQGAGSLPLEPYVNDRPYAASSFLSGALRAAFGTAMAGRSKERPELAQTALPFQVHLPALPSRGGPDLAQRLFGPLGYRITARPHPLDPAFPEWGDIPYLDLTLETEARLKDLLAHLSVLIPVLDDAKHYYVDESEVDKLLRLGEGWLESHPERDLITRRALKHQRSLQRAVQAQFADDGEEEVTPPEPRLNDQRLDAVTAELLASGAKSVLDLGCGEGRLLARLLPERQFERLIGMDVSLRELARASSRLRLDELPETYRQRLTLIQGSLTYRDARLSGYDAAALVEVIEHLDPQRLWTLERVVFGQARPGTVVVTTPNEEYNATWTTLPAGSVRHTDHRFEWTRTQFQAWAGSVAESYGYGVIFKEIGLHDEALGSPTQMAIFNQEAGQ